MDYSPLLCFIYSSSEMTWGCTLVCYPWSNPWREDPRLASSLESAIWHEVQDFGLAVAYMESVKHINSPAVSSVWPSYQLNKYNLYLQPSLTPLLSRYPTHCTNCLITFWTHRYTAPSGFQHAGLCLIVTSEQVPTVRAGTDDWTPNSTDTTCHSTN